MEKKDKKVRPEVAHDLAEIPKALKQFTPWLKAVAEKKGQSVKMLFQ